jgi:tetratricopeptide (TPR) repeat protein
MRFFQGDRFVRNDLPISMLARDTVTFPVAGVSEAVQNPESKIDLWQRWNDYGIGLFRKGEKGSSKGELRQAEAAFAEVEKLGRPDGPLNRARVYIKEGRLDEAVTALNQAAAHDPPAPPWSVAWFTGLVNKQNGHLDEAIANFTAIIDMKDTAECRKREFDFSQDYVLLAELGQTLFERAKQERGDGRKAERERLLNEAARWFERALSYDSEDLGSHYNLSLIYAQLGNDVKAEEHRVLHRKYKPDDNAADRAIAIARMNDPAANHAAEQIVIYDLQREGAYELPRQAQGLVRSDVPLVAGGVCGDRPRRGGGVLDAPPRNRGRTDRSGKVHAAQVDRRARDAAAGHVHRHHARCRHRLHAHQWSRGRQAAAGDDGRRLRLSRFRQRP